MRIKVIGKAHLKGTSKKTGKPYDCIQVRNSGPARGLEGLAALSGNLDPALHSFANVVIVGEYNLESDTTGAVPWNSCPPPGADGRPIRVPLGTM